MNSNCEVIAIACNKGGVAKSTSAVNLAYDYAALRHMKTLLIDMDPHGSVSEFLGIQMQAGSPTVYEALRSKKPLPIYGISENLSIVPSSPLLENIVECLFFEPYKDKSLRLAMLINAVRYSYQRIIIDTPPNLGLATKMALYASDYLIIPIEPSIIAWNGAEEEKDFVKEIIEDGGHIALLGMFFTRFGRLKVCKEVEELLTQRESPDAHGEIKYLFRTKIREYKDYKESTTCGMSIFQYAPESKAAIDSKDLTDEVELRIKQYKAWKK